MLRSMHWFRPLSIAILVATFAISSTAQAGPTTRPTETIVELKLQDPLTAQSWCYVDLDSGEIFQRGETFGDMLESRRWIRENGIDLMCESREPANGLVAYDLKLRANTVDINSPPDFVTLRRMFEKAESQPFDFVSPGQSLPKTYLFRTRDGAMGVLAITEMVEKPSGMRIRYRLVPEPPRAPLVRDPNGARAMQFAMRVNVQQLRVNKLRETYGDNHPLVTQAERMVVLYQDMAKISTTEADPRMQALKMNQLSAEYQLEQLRAKLPGDSAAVVHARGDLEILKGRIRDLEAARGKVWAPATRPAPVMPVTPATRPFAEDFHL